LLVIETHNNKIDLCEFIYIYIEILKNETLMNLDKSNLCGRGGLRNMEAIVSQLIFWFQNTNYLAKDHHKFYFETSIR